MDLFKSGAIGARGPSIGSTTYGYSPQFSLLNNERVATISENANPLRVRSETERDFFDRRKHNELEEMLKAMQSALNLGELRIRRDSTQNDLANRLGVSQANVSRIEHVGDVYLTTLRGYIEAIGGHLRLQAVFGDETVDIT